ncbi:hypothetical protein FH972_024548 [Carpinus fangiana]|uniref:Uncharacterized protein n=1 Tax=Carpinus fangiana TaxID=176857 RepID=A0A5N6L0V1_9ROSI|nr:hypothetical protein FH972_024548 [Carpinus fangiana]
MMEIRKPRRILCIGPPDSGVLTLLADLTGSAPTPQTVTPSHGESAATDASPILEPAAENDPSSPEKPSAPHITTAGLTHALALTTKYYTATVPMWLDEVAILPSTTSTSLPEAPQSSRPLDTHDSPSTDTDNTLSTKSDILQASPADTAAISAWKADFLDPAAAEVTAALGAWIVVFRKHGAPLYRRGVAKLLRAVEEVIERQGEGLWEGGMFAIGMPGTGFVKASADVVDANEGNEDELWEEICFEHGFEYIDGAVAAEEGAKRDALGEVKGVARLKEALEACDWTAEGGNSEEDELGLLEDGDDEEFGEAVAGGEHSLGFNLESAQLGSEFADLSDSLRQHGHGWDDEEQARQVDELEKMMGKLHAARGMFLHESMPLSFIALKMFVTDITIVDMGAHLPEAQRKKFAAKAVSDVLRDLGADVRANKP